MPANKLSLRELLNKFFFEGYYYLSGKIFNTEELNKWVDEFLSQLPEVILSLEGMPQEKDSVNFEGKNYILPIDEGYNQAYQQFKEALERGCK